MPRVHHVKKARKDNPVCKKGESYYWWKFRYGGKRYSLTPPRPSQLTQSAYYGSVRSLVEQIQDTEVNDNDDFTSLRDDVTSEIDCIRSECQENLDNMPEQLQYAPTGELLQERIDALDNAESEVDGIDEFDEDEPELDDYEQDCPECSGSGVNPFHEEDDSDDVCDQCCGTGQISGREEFEQAHSEWKDQIAEWADQAKDELIDYVSECEV